MSFTIFQNEKKPFQGIKTRSSKNRKNSHFSKGVNPWFWKKNGHFSNLFFLGNIGQKNVFYDILQRKNTFLGYKKRGSKSQKIDIFPNGLTHGFGPKTAIFPSFFFFGNIAQENVPYDILERKNAFLGYERLTHGFGPKITIF